jgi:hypothetical protein
MRNGPRGGGMGRAVTLAEQNGGSSPIVMLVLRFLCNLHLTSAGRRLACGVSTRAARLAGDHAISDNKNIKAGT